MRILRLIGIVLTDTGWVADQVIWSDQQIPAWVFLQITWDFLHPELFPLLQIIDGRVFLDDTLNKTLIP